MSILNQAINLYKNKNYRQALSLFEKVAEIYDVSWVEANIKLCQTALNLSEEVDKLNRKAVIDIDAATKIMCSNAKAISLNEVEKNEIISKYREITAKKSERAELKEVEPIPLDWPSDLTLPPLPESTNDYVWAGKRKELDDYPRKQLIIDGLSIVIPTYNRAKILAITLACLCNQKTIYDYEVIVADDGSKENIEEIVREFESLLNIKYVRQKDYGYQLCAVRNLGLRAAKYNYVAILDCDMAPNPLWVQSYMELLAVDDNVALIGPRKYIDTSKHTYLDFLSQKSLINEIPEIITNNQVAGKVEQNKSVDWRIEHFKNTDNLRLCNTPFRFFSGGNVAFAKKWLFRAGWFDEEFTHWGGEDNEFGYRLYREGCYFRSVEGAMAYHQEPPGKENETDRAAGKNITVQLLQQKVPYFYRKKEKIESATLKRVPLVSIYIPAYNCSKYIVRCVESVLNQTITDLEVCICDDGSTDDTLRILQEHYANHPRVRFISQKNKGIGSASNTAVRLCRGFYIGQLDSDDFLEPDAVELCLDEFRKDLSLACVYTTNRNIDREGNLISNGYNWPIYSREKLTSAMICHHFRMFTARAWNLTEGFNESISNAVDYDMYLKLSEVGPFKHINKICYNRVLHGENTSIKKLDIQKENHFKVVNESLSRLGIKKYKYSPLTNLNECRKYTWEKIENDL
ncbi:acetylgalactosaminyl-proteoglycan 3-beta-glucuronosyltransferase [Escherichia coli]|uniref:glycosyltransferase family 2 protein n=1 Tax=Escherichia coli TaxID=562 RepID=UPI00092AEB8A|nr:glycosyltransferase [Escherichia coli]MCH6533249.1 acetylgalactosaminyl-proteoglycan 3-beta-glucuronosyltransferase [Escherichia coli]MCO5011710.1 glycosyltransferase [Escherichia coli]MDM8900842.1 glycosyltransferase [Escherichia coli]OJR15835.1 acetylgalactosaminyl-proteoglycan 3-beta-glucuronosyltransferase [Escherichia coli]